MKEKHPTVCSCPSVILRSSQMCPLCREEYETWLDETAARLRTEGFMLIQRPRNYVPTHIVAAVLP